jgi:hypothetical protein
MEGRELTALDRSAQCEELLLMKEESDKRVRFLQYINTGLLTLILGIASMLSVQFSRTHEMQTIQTAELLRIKTVQDINTTNIGILDSRVKTLEIGYSQDLKNWVELNFVRRPQLLK